MQTGAGERERSRERGAWAHIPCTRTHTQEEEISRDPGHPAFAPQGAPSLQIAKALWSVLSVEQQVGGQAGSARSCPFDYVVSRAKPWSNPLARKFKPQIVKERGTHWWQRKEETDVRVSQALE